jgi:hypothetical protein
LATKQEDLNDFRDNYLEEPREAKTEPKQKERSPENMRRL